MLKISSNESHKNAHKYHLVTDCKMSSDKRVSKSCLFCPCGPDTHIPKYTNGYKEKIKDEAELIRNLIEDLI